MDSRLELHEILVSLLGSRNVYFQPPSSIKLIYPCIIYGLENIKITYADSIKYANKKAYGITLIDQNLDSDIPDRILTLNYCTFDRHFIADNLNHYAFTLFYKN